MYGAKGPRKRNSRYALRFLERHRAGYNSYIMTVMQFLVLVATEEVDGDLPSELFFMTAGTAALAQLMEFVVNAPQRLPRGPANKTRLRVHHLLNMDDEYCMSNFRFRAPHLIRLFHALDLYDHDEDDWIRIDLQDERHYLPADVCMLIFLARLSHPCRYVDLIPLIGEEINRLCPAMREITHYVYNNFAYPLTRFELWQDSFDSFGDIMRSYGAPYPNLIGLIDGNFLRCCRPGGEGNWEARMPQELLYNGKEKAHGLKFLAVLFANGMVCLYGPVEGKMHDATLLRTSMWMQFLEQMQANGNGHHILFGDCAFPCTRNIQCMFKGAMETSSARFNELMAKIRISVENCFAEQSIIWHFLTHENKNAVGRSPVQEYYTIATFLMNCRGTLYGNQMMSQVGVALNLPSLESYINKRH